MSATLVLDTSVAVPLLVETHPEHAVVRRWRGTTSLAFSGHALAETYSVLTRLPGDLRTSARDVAEVLTRGFERPVVLASRTAIRLPALLADLEIAGGAVYDALVALAARDAGRVLATRDAKARPTYAAVGVEIEVVG